jgi:hypothetical protein
MAEAYFKQKKYLLSMQYVQKSILISKEMGVKELTEGCYELKTRLDSALGDNQHALIDYKIYKQYGDSLVNADNIKRTTTIGLKHEFDLEQRKMLLAQGSKLAFVHAKAKGERVISWSIIIGLAIFVLLICALLYWRHSHWRKDKEVLEIEKENLIEKQRLMVFRQKRTEEDLIIAQSVLQDYAGTLLKKNEYIEKYKTELEKLKSIKLKEVYEEGVERRHTLVNTSILTDEDWYKFKELFEGAYPGFFIRLKDKFPELTPAEVRLICLSRLKLDTRQMAGILGVSPESVRKSRYRLRKKLDIPGDQPLEDVSVTI